LSIFTSKTWGLKTMTEKQLDELYNIIEEVLLENRIPKEFRDLIIRSIIGRCSRAGYIKME